MLDFSKIIEILGSMETEKSFRSVDELKNLIKERKLSYEDLLDFAACSIADSELYKFENEELKKLLDAYERLLEAERGAAGMLEDNYKGRLVITELSQEVTTTRRFFEGQIQGREAQKKMHGVAAANARHSKPGGSRDKQQKIRMIWASGKYSSRDICAEQEGAALGMSFSSARKALRGEPDPA